MAENRLSKQSYRSIATLLTTWQGFNKIRQARGMKIAHCYVVLSCVLIEARGERITQGAIRRLLVMHNSYVIRQLVNYLLRNDYLVSAGSSRCGHRSYYALTDAGRSLAIDLLNGCEVSQVAFFNKFPLSF